jgi:fructose-bisphosphate aldolase class II
MPLLNFSEVLTRAYQNHYAVGSFNITDFILLEGILDAAQEMVSPVILSIAEVHLKYFEIERVTGYIQKIALQTNLPIVLNLDHGINFETIFRAVRNGFTSVMFDGSKLDYEENIKQTREVVHLCHKVNISVEAELGGVGGDEAGGLLGEADKALFTVPEMAEDFVRRTQIDALAVAIGNVHGKYRGEPKLDFNRLKDIKHRTNIPLVLHGGSGIPDKDFRKAISYGISKINFYTGMTLAALEEIEKSMSGVGKKYHDYPELILSIKNRIKQVVKYQMGVFGCAGKA